MAVVSPPFALGSPTVAHPAFLDRLAIGSIWLPTTGVAVRTGILHGPAGSLGECALAGDGSSVSVQPFRAVVQSAYGADDGAYVIINNAAHAAPVPARHPTLGSRALLATWLADSEAGDLPSNDENDGAWLAVIPGTPAASPALPAEPSNSIVFGELTIPSTAAGGPITFTPRAVPRTALRGQPLPVANAAARTALAGLFAGLDVIQLDTGRRYYYTGSAWQIVPLEVIPPVAYYATQADRVAADGGFDGQLAVELDQDRWLRWTGGSWKYLGDHLVVANASARDALFPAYAGLTVRLANTGEAFYHNGSGWVSAIPASAGPLGVIARVDVSGSFGETFTSGPTNVPLTTGRLYRVTFLVRRAYFGGTAADADGTDGRLYGRRSSSAATTSSTPLGEGVTSALIGNGTADQGQWRAEEYVTPASSAGHSFGALLNAGATGTYAGGQWIIEDVGSVANLTGSSTYTTITATT